MPDIPISDALIDAAQFVIQTIPPPTTETGNVRLFRGTDGWAEKSESGTVGLVGDFGIRRKVTPLSADQITGLHNTPVLLVPSQGAGTIVLPLFVVVNFVGGSTPYTITDGTRLWVGYGVGTDEPYNTGYLAIPADSCLAGTQHIVHTFVVGNDTTGELVILDTTTVNKSLACQIDPTHPLTDGNGTAEIITFWTVV